MTPKRLSRDFRIAAHRLRFSRTPIEVRVQTFLRTPSVR